VACHVQLSDFTQILKTNHDLQIPVLWIIYMHRNLILRTAPSQALTPSPTFSLNNHIHLI